MKTKIIFSICLLIAFSLMTGFMYIKSTEVKHIVIFKYKEKTTPAQIEEVTQAFKALKGKIPGIVSFEYGVNNSPENLNKGFTHAYLLTFKDVASRDAYLPHPEHNKFGELLGRLDVLEEPFVVDFQLTE
ncbi:MAG TPA: Dabb family protein [Chryseolinea sp.]|nr:Dabb family protein [Chryseolinea sp.]HPM29217.1 Dabb family protein [Chryseolinea sp.]